MNPKAKKTDLPTLDNYEALLMPRLIEEKMLSLLRQNKISKWFSGIGQEAISVGVALAASPTDPMFTMHRNLGVFTARGVPFHPLFCQLFGKAPGFTGGRERSFHFGIPEHHIYGMISHLAATMPIADGIALACKLRGDDRVAFSFCGDGGTSEGDFHESLNLAAVWKLPIVFIIENNGYGLSTPVSEQYACEHLVDRAKGYGLMGFRADGNDLDTVMRTVRNARKAALGGTPCLIEFETFRMRGHEEASGTDYVPKELLERWAEKDPVATYRQKLISSGLLDPSADDRLKKALRKRYEADLSEALAAEEPVFNEEKELADAAFLPFVPPAGGSSVAATPAAKPPATGADQPARTDKRFIDAIRDAMDERMRTDPSLILMGQDIAAYGGVFKATEGFLERFGADRVRNTPIIESGAVGAAMGLALGGHAVMVEMQFADFISCAYNQIVNNLSKGRWRWMPPMNVTIRCPHGAGVGAGPFHSQSPEGWFMDHPGLRILVPSTVEDAQDMLHTALADPNPVLYFEHKKLYRSLKDMVPTSPAWTDLDKAAIRRAGADLSILTYGLGVHWALKAADEWQGKGVSIEVVDLRSLAPIDWQTLSESARRTGRVLLLQEPSQTAGPMSEIAAGLVERVFEHLDAPILRCSSLDMPIPFSRALESAYLADSRLDASISRLIGY